MRFIIVLLPLVLIGCAKSQSSSEQDSKVFWCVGACASLDTEIQKDTSSEELDEFTINTTTEEDDK